MMMNGELIQKRLQRRRRERCSTTSLQRQGATAVEQGRSDSVSGHLCRAPPVGREIQDGSSVLMKDRVETPLEAIQDLCWALLNTNEFILNH